MRRQVWPAHQLRPLALVSVAGCSLGASAAPRSTSMTSDIDHSTAQAPEKQLTNTRALVIQNGPKNGSEEDKRDEI